MSNRKILRALLVGLLIMTTAVPVLGDEKSPVASVPSVKKGNPPPGRAMSLSVPEARAMLKNAIAKRYVGTIKSCSRVLMIKGCEVIIPTAATDVRVGRDGFEFAAPYTFHITAGGAPSSHENNVSVKFKKDQEYIQVFQQPRFYPGTKTKVNTEPDPLFRAGYLPDPERSAMGEAVCAWTDEAAAREFADAFNRLLYAAYWKEEEEMEFHAAAKAWRENAQKPPLSEEANRHRVLAENAIQERNLPSAVEHYQTAVEVQPMWPAGWFNLAMIQAEQNNYGDAAYCMRHYLELMPDAPDAKDARDQVIIWEDKAKR